jgi:hypothetical protein
MAGVPDEVPLHVQIHFLKNVVLSFGLDPPARSEWLGKRAAQYGEHLEDLMLLANVHDTYEKAIGFLEILTRPQQTSKSRTFSCHNFIFFSLLISFTSPPSPTRSIPYLLISFLILFYSSPNYSSTTTSR